MLVSCLAYALTLKMKTDSCLLDVGFLLSLLFDPEGEGNMFL
jgi:hypothetical protein